MTCPVPATAKLAVQLKHDPLCGFYMIATYAGRTVINTGYRQTEQGAREEMAARLQAFRQSAVK